RPLPTPVKALLGAGVAAALLAALEGGLRLLRVPGSGLYAGDPAWVWTLRPDLDQEVPGPAGPFRVQTNALGLRGDPPPAVGPWTLALGCSTTFGWGVETDEAWPARLEHIIGSPVVNAGVPGWSTAQAMRGAGPWLDLGPSRVILAFGVRDAWPAHRTDAAARPTHPLLRSNLVRLFRGLVGQEPGRQHATPLPPETGTWRVAPADFKRNMQDLIDRAGDAQVVLLWFPQQKPRTPWRKALEELGPVLAPDLPASAFFEDDPVHLSPAGHAALADFVARGLSGTAAPAP
ncbi:MAG: SGNH/GDSL hydrolase family protein, partial [Myxococcota bacterium]|nr:SGNH/GDSL hydrolase family protein [Myxococcota bacterium]